MARYRAVYPGFLFSVTDAGRHSNVGSTRQRSIRGCHHPCDPPRLIRILAGGAARTVVESSNAPPEMPPPEPGQGVPISTEQRKTPADHKVPGPHADITVSLGVPLACCPARAEQFDPTPGVGPVRLPMAGRKAATTMLICSPISETGFALAFTSVRAASAHGIATWFLAGCRS
jgi:hypothetical protein